MTDQHRINVYHEHSATQDAIDANRGTVMDIPNPCAKCGHDKNEHNVPPAFYQRFHLFPIWGCTRRLNSTSFRYRVGLWESPWGLVNLKVCTCTSFAERDNGLR